LERSIELASLDKRRLISFAKFIVLQGFGLNKSIVLTIAAPLIRKFARNLFVSFDSANAVDGTGAQLQRLVSVVALSEYFGFRYISSNIKSISVHPLDPFQRESDYRAQLVRTNNFLVIPNSDLGTPDMTTVNIPRLTIRILLLQAFFQVLNHKPRRLDILEVYPVTEFCPNVYEGLKCEISESVDWVETQSGGHLVLHYRQGVGGNVVYPGQKIPRQIELSRIVHQVQLLIEQETLPLLTQITVLTDAPSSISYFSPPQDQQSLWEGTPGFANGIMTIQPMDFSELASVAGVPVEVVRGGNPLDAIKMMAMADVLIMSKSSLSFMGALLNKGGTIFFPKSFWHKPLKTWVKYDG